jgi:hypothetical protein
MASERCVRSVWTGKGGFLNRLILGWTIVKFDVVHEEPVRDKYGRCIPCEGEPWPGTSVGDPHSNG